MNLLYIMEKLNTLQNSSSVKQSERDERKTEEEVKEAKHEERKRYKVKDKQITLSLCQCTLDRNTVK